MNLPTRQSLLDLELEPLFKMKKFIFIFLFFLINFKSFSAYGQIAYIDINFILNKSEIGKSLNNYLSKKKNQNLEKLKLIEDDLINKEELLLSQQNILEKNEFDKRARILSEEIKKYRSEKKMLNDSLNDMKVKNTKKILEFLNPIITNYVEKNSISLVIPKKNIIIGQKKLDITEKIIKLLNDQKKSLNF